MSDRVHPSRDTSIDIAKGIGMLFVVAGHCDFAVMQGMPAFSFHMPFFFFVSGFFINFSDSFGNFLHKKFFSLIVPFALYYVSFGVISYLLHYTPIAWSHSSLAAVFNVHTLVVAPIIGGIIVQMAIPLWFITALFISMCIVFVVGKGLVPFRGTGPFRVVGLVFVLLALYYALIYLMPLIQPAGHHFPQFVIRVVVGAIFCVFGYLYYKSPLADCYKANLIIGSLVYAVLTLRYGYYTIDMIGNNYGEPSNKIFSMLYVLAAIMMVLSVAKHFSRDNSRLVDGLVFLGKNSFHIMALHLCGFFVVNLVAAALLPEVSLNDVHKANYIIPRIEWVYFMVSLAFSVLVIKGFDAVKATWNKYAR